MTCVARLQQKIFKLKGVLVRAQPLSSLVWAGCRARRISVRGEKVDRLKGEPEAIKRARRSCEGAS